jgi:hypothetical protein
MAQLMTEAGGNGAPPVANRIVVQGELKHALSSRRRNRHSSVLLLRAAPEWRGDPDFEAEIEGSTLPVTVAVCPTVLAVLDAMAVWSGDGGYLVVLTPRDPQEVGDSVLARAMLPEIKPINRWDLVRDAFGARRLDESLARSTNHWIAEGLLEVQPADGWRRLPGPVLTRATALNRLAAARLGINAADDSAVDGAALLQWTFERAAVESFKRLSAAERGGLAAWLTETTGDVARAVFAMTDTDKVTEAIAVGLAFGALYGGQEQAEKERSAPERTGPARTATRRTASEHAAEVPDQPDEDGLIVRVRAEERFFGGRPIDPSGLRPFWEAAESLVTRWAANGHAAEAAQVCDQAEAILTGLGAVTAARRSRVLQAGLDARFSALAADLADCLTGVPGALARAERTVSRIRDHVRLRDRAADVSVAEAAVRAARWLSLDEAEPATAADGALLAYRSWAWADRALAVVARADPGRLPELARVCALLHERATIRRARLDAALVRLLARTGPAGQAGPGQLLAAEQILEQVARPVAAQRPPVIVVLGGLGAAAACELADEIAMTGRWIEAGRRDDGRELALAPVPPAAVFPRADTPAGESVMVGMLAEQVGFATFWGRRPSALFHAGDLGDSGQPLAGKARDAILDPAVVVGIVLAFIEASGVSQQSDPRGQLDAAPHLRAVLDEARRASRPVILIGAPGPDARPGAGIIPLLSLFPSLSLVPPRWSDYDAVGHAPGWWEEATVTTQQTVPDQEPKQSAASARTRGKRAAVPPADEPGVLFGVREVMSAGAPTPAEEQPAAPTSKTRTAELIVTPKTSALGTRVAASARLTSQRVYLRRAPDDAKVSALIDGLERAGGQLTLAEAAALVDQPAVRMSGYLAQVGRLLNVDGYGVLQVTDGGKTVKLDLPLLRQQFLGE